MASAYPCHVCGEPGRLVGYGPKQDPIFQCRAPICDVIEFDRQRIRSRELPPRQGIALPGIRRQRLG